MRRWVAVVGLLTLLVFVFGPTAYASIAGPMYIDCGALEPDLCDEVWRNDDVSWPVTWVVVDPLNNGVCGDYTIGYWWPAYDPTAITYMPLCQG